MSFYNSLKILINITIIIIIGIIIWWFYKEKRVNDLEKRLGKYTIESKDNHELTFFDYLTDFYNRWQGKLIKLFSKSKFLKDYSKKYEKYITSKNNKDSMKYIVGKFIGSIVAFILVILTDIFQNTTINFFEIIIALIFGFYLPDIFLLSRKFVIRKSQENDLLKAVTIMNNCFKSGRSIMQTIEIVSKELDGPLKKEFAQMVTDLNYGLTLENVFERLENRVKLDELKYISTSLSILNKTGGNIVKVFSSIEKTFFNNRKLKEELKNLTASAKFLYYVLIFVPIIFTLLIYILDPAYFNPLFTNFLGIIILIFILFIYISYILIVKKIISIKE